MNHWIRHGLLMTLLLLAACDSSDDDADPMAGGTTTPGGSSPDGSSGSTDLIDIVSQVADSESSTLDVDALDTQLATTLGDRDTAEPVAFETEDTAESIVRRTQSP